MRGENLSADPSDQTVGPQLPAQCVAVYIQALGRSALVTFARRHHLLEKQLLELVVCLWQLDTVAHHLLDQFFHTLVERRFAFLLSHLLPADQDGLKSGNGWPVRTRYASAYFAAVREMISPGSSGPGGVLSQSSVCR